MKSATLKLAVAFTALGAMAHGPAMAAATEYPVKAIRLIVPFPPGGGNDVIARVVGQKLSERWGQQVIVDNRGGANGMVGLQLLTQAPPDGYTLAVAAAGPMAVNPSLYEKIPYDPLRDFSPVTNMVNFLLLLVTHPSFPAATVKDIIALAKKSPDKVNYASPGSGNSGHLAGELLNSMAKVKIVHVPYKGAGPAITDLLAGQVQMMFSSIPSVLPHVQAGKLKAVAVGSAKRLASLPDIPTVAESGVPGYEAYSWVGMVAPAKTPRDIVMKLNREIIDILKVKSVADSLLQQGAIPDVNTPEGFAAYIKSENAKWGAVVRAAHIKAD
jgi:tripartite-type tricarboxylate transporter receptor subunit TctC